MAGIKGEPEIIYPEKKRFSLLDLVLQETVIKSWRACEKIPPP